MTNSDPVVSSYTQQSIDDDDGANLLLIWILMTYNNEWISFCDSLVHSFVESQIESYKQIAKGIHKTHESLNVVLFSAECKMKYGFKDGK